MAGGEAVIVLTAEGWDLPQYCPCHSFFAEKHTVVHYRSTARRGGCGGKPSSATQATQAQSSIRFDHYTHDTPFILQRSALPIIGGWGISELHVVALSRVGSG